MKRIFILAVLLTCAGLLAAQDGAVSAGDIIYKAKNRVQSESVSTRSRMVITAKNGSTKELILDQYSKDGPNGARTVVVFQSPANSKGTRFLTMNNAAGKSDQWIFLPSLGKIRRIAASESGGSFMGTDFSYDDISSMDRDTSLDTHKLLREEVLNGNACYVVESVPKDTTWQYSRTLTWVDKENSLIYKAEMYNRRGEPVKVMEMSDYRDMQGRLSPMQTKISTVAAGTSTTIFMDIMKYDDPIPDGVFTPAFLETGRVK